MSNRTSNLLTTTIGAYPKPANAPVPMWSELGERRRAALTEVYDAILENQADAERRTLDTMTIEAVREQAACGIDIPTDGEIRREHYIYYHLRHIEGIDFANLTEKVMRDGSWSARVPTIRSALAAGTPFLPVDWTVAQSATDRPVKITVPGPLTISDSIADDYYGDRATMARALADVLNVEIRRLADAGCQWIQVDEPLFAREVDAALAFGVECLERCFSGVPTPTRRAVHICCGYPKHMDQTKPPKAPAEAYPQLAPALDAAAVDAVSIEDAHRHNDLSLLEMFTRTSVILGIVNISSSRIETVEELRERLLAALSHIEPSRLIAAPDCGLALMSQALAVEKLANLSEAAHRL
ncbi:MAG: 5-methyltetrahydropteroyltriglutamate--homocysteine methyltransferase [Hyphomicrobiales bacterium]|nr:5-methyltetrahydropteroyltriglutamate--homocysteine methyltransferase [Hyphomicrobiales bacterium]